MSEFNLQDFLNGANAVNPTEGGYSDVTFEGFLASADIINDNGEADKAYFTIDTSGKALRAFKSKSKKPLSLLFNIVTPRKSEIHENDANSPRRPRPTNKGVEVLRYYRPTNEFGEVSNLGGMTALCSLNYDEMSITVYPSFCMTKDNFDKRLGYEYALDSQGQHLGFKVELIRDVPIIELIRSAMLGHTAFTWLNHESKHKFKTPLIKAISAINAYHGE